MMTEKLQLDENIALSVHVVEVLIRFSIKKTEEIIETTNIPLPPELHKQIIFDVFDRTLSFLENIDKT